MEITIEQGFIILRHSKGLDVIGFFIRRLTESFWNHVGEVVEDMDGSLWVIEATMKGVAKTPIAEFINPAKHIIKIVELLPTSFRDSTEYDKAITLSAGYLRANVGKKYDKKAIIWLALNYTILAIFGRSKDNPLQDRKEFFCSELICSSWHGTSSVCEHLFAGVKRPKDECSIITPKDIGKSVNVIYVTGKDVK